MTNDDVTKMYDTHTHFNDQVYQEEMFPVEVIVDEAMADGVGYFNNVGFSLKSSIKAIEQAKNFDNVFAIIGIHPNEVKQHLFDDLDSLDRLANDVNVVAIGEVGLDYYYTKEDKELQQEWLKKQIKLAIKHNLPLMLHIRDKIGVYEAYEDVLTIVTPFKDELKAIIVHCFSANQEYADKFLAIGAYLAIGGAVTFKNAKELQEVTKNLPLNQLLVETDAPYLTPDPYRGKLNFSKFLGLTVKKIAELQNLSEAEIIFATTTNSLKLFMKER